MAEFIDFMISSKDISASQRLKCLLDMFIRFPFVRNFAEKFGSSSCGSLLGVELSINFFADLRMSLGLLECFDLYKIK